MNQITMKKFEIGIDEVGRGCLAGPVFVAAVLIADDFKPPKHLPELKDSKETSPSNRKIWAEWIGTGALGFAVSSVDTKTIEELNISGAANLGAWQSLSEILRDCPNIEIDVVLDGGLFIKSKKFQEEFSKEKNITSIKTVVGADNKFNSVKLASVLAKVLRDEHMQLLSIDYPEFGFEKHKGYGTKQHKEAIKKNGLIEGIHRTKFCEDILNGRSRLPRRVEMKP